MSLPDHVTIREVCLRDGLQIEDPIPLSAKLELLEAVVATGVREVEATAFVSPSKVPSLADAAALAAELPRLRHGVEFSALVADIARIAHANDATAEVIIATGWDCPFDGPTDPQRVVDIATEDLVYMLHDSGIGVDVDLQAAIHAAGVARTAVGHDLPSALLRAGDRILS